MDKRVLLMVTLLLLCALIPLQKTTAAPSAEVVGESSEIIFETDEDNITFSIRVTTEDGDTGTYNVELFGFGIDMSYDDPNTGLPIYDRTVIGFEEGDYTASPTSLTLNGEGTHDISITVPRSKIPDRNDNIDFYLNLRSPDNPYDPDDPDTWDPFFASDILYTVYWREPNDLVADIRLSTRRGDDVQVLSPDQISDLTFTLRVENVSSEDPVSVTFSVGLIGGAALVDPSGISFSPASVVLAPNGSAAVVVTILGSLFIKPGSSFFTIRATPSGGVSKTFTLRVNIAEGADLLLDSQGGLKQTSTISDTEDITYTLRLTNTGSSSDRINFTVSGDIETATVSLSSIELFPDSYEDITLTIPRTALAEVGTYNIAVKATSVNDPTVTATAFTTTIITSGVTSETDPTQPSEPTDPTPTEPVTHKVVLSEFMFEVGVGKTVLPQWIEVYNNSSAEVNLQGWKLQLKSLGPSPLDATVTLNSDFRIPVQQARLIVTALGRHSGGGNLSDAFVYQLLPLPLEGPAEETVVHHFQHITGEGFSIKLTTSEDVLVDHIGTLSGDSKTWELPECFIEGFRSSLIRRFDKGVPRSGIEKRAWRRAYDAKRLVKGIYYGSPNDLGTPGYRHGKPLPVELSHFSAKFVKNEVVINWTTESELNNAGFNIFRSTSRTKNFQRINLKLIQGAGTTGQRTQYQFIDKTTKPNVPYYYRLEDVELAGTRGILTTYRLRGVIAPTGKHITTWGTLKDNR